MLLFNLAIWPVTTLCTGLLKGTMMRRGPGMGRCSGMWCEKPSLLLVVPTHTTR
ncbi:Hypp721 [Branchiostoma lanceolatum]|uniref:Hypp721 protein n=1 Tax=Branchiostoma lanceolatum TaxID=7740 RepID=A0A8J9YRB1_BRALA|nr:Hypp721 [Branchiostoma lanceolatum]